MDDLHRKRLLILLACSVLVFAAAFLFLRGFNPRVTGNDPVLLGTWKCVAELERGLLFREKGRYSNTWEGQEFQTRASWHADGRHIQVEGSDDHGDRYTATSEYFVEGDYLVIYDPTNIAVSRSRIYVRLKMN